MKSEKTAAIKYQFLMLLVFLFSAAMCIQSIDDLNGYRFYLYLPDFSIGYCTKMLQGSVLSIFKDTFTKEWLYNFMRGAVVFASLIFSVYIGRFVSEAPAEKRIEYLVLAFFFATSPYSVCVFSEVLGLQDVYWYIFIVIALICMRNKVLMWLVPLLSVLCVANHIAYLVIIFPVLFIVLLHQSGYGKNSGAKRALFIVTILFTGAAAIYALAFQDKTLKMPIEEMLAYTTGKVDFEVNSLGYEAFLYGISPAYPAADGYVFGTGIPAIISNLIKIARNNVATTAIFKTFIAILPVLVFVNFIWLSALRSAKKIFERAIYGFCFLSELVLPFLWIISTDIRRWGALFCTSQLLMLIWLLAEKDKYISDAFDKVTAWIKKYPLLAVGALCLNCIIP